MSAEQPTVLPWHREAAKETYNHIGDWAYASGVEPIAAIIARHDEGRTDSPALRLLEEAKGGLCDVSRYPVASAYPDGPCLERETHDNVCKLLIEIRAHLAAMKGSQ